MSDTQLHQVAEELKEQAVEWFPVEYGEPLARSLLAGQIQGAAYLIATLVERGILAPGPNWEGERD